MVRIGAHVSISPKPIVAVDSAIALKANTIQIFTHNARSWNFKELDEKQLKAFRDGVEEASISPVIAHSGYLLNPAATGENFDKSRDSLAKELEYADAFGCNYLVVHMGKHGLSVKAKAKAEDVAKSIEEGIERMVNMFTALRTEIIAANTMIIMENTSGCGSSMGGDLSEITTFISRLPDDIRPKVGICLDTCHLHAAGYGLDITRVAKSVARIRADVDLSLVKAIHVNDSKGAVGSLLDRHEHLGLGDIGAEGLGVFLSTPELAGLPLILETPVDEKNGHETNMRALRRIVARKG
ncbi:AP endonuclease 2 [Carpediemonas membranifera]|uniref:AP endonuclease 2 n=1 Tax=Carpediemonas membranifera TaxID=201153 RepID=A0A8J6E063_9EUKA|nr:AP endonuclease 2 [Carpediemonas membranifera]|eukprot:KAG9394629.1 AP endonuclease 2 [Carpediemonas membranifera]